MSEFSLNSKLVAVAVYRRVSTGICLMRVCFNTVIMERYEFKIHVVHRSSETLKFGPNSQFGDFHSK